MKHNNISVYKDIKDICSVMKGCDIAVSAGGTTLAELSACGIPTVCFSIADNQLDGVRAYADKGIMFYAGDVRIDKVGVVSRVCEGVMQLICDKDIRKRRSIKAKEFVDGLGAMRIAKEIIKL